MNKGLIGKKIGMTQIFDESGKVIPVTVIEAGPCVVAQVKTKNCRNRWISSSSIRIWRYQRKEINKTCKRTFYKSKCYT